MKIDQSEALAVDPALLFDLSVAYWRSSVLFTSLELGLFDILGIQGKSVPQLAGEIEVPKRSLLMLIKALKALNLLTIEGERVKNTPLTQTYLCKHQPNYLGDTIMFNARSFPAWGGLTQAVRENKPAMDTSHFLGKDQAATRNFVLAMHNRAKGSASCLVNMLDFSDRKNLLDLGGGPGTYSMMLAEKFPELKTTIIDLEGIQKVASEIINTSLAKDRIILKPGDIFTDNLGSGFDAALISGVLHRTEGDATVKFLRKVSRSLEPKGLLAISDLFTGVEDCGPVLPELFSLHMMLTAKQGQSLHLPDMEGILSRAGFKLIKVIPYPLPLPHTLCIGEKL